MMEYGVVVNRDEREMREKKVPDKWQQSRGSQVTSRQGRRVAASVGIVTLVT